MTRKATAVERPRCVHCRNPIKEHQAAVGPQEGDRTFHEDCWTAAHPGQAPGGAAPEPTAPAVAAQPVASAVAEGQLVEQRTPESAETAARPVAETSSEQRDYEQRIAHDGLAALLSPYVCGLPAQRDGVQSIPA